MNYTRPAASRSLVSPIPVAIQSALHGVAIGGPVNNPEIAFLYQGNLLCSLRHWRRIHSLVKLNSTIGP